MPVTAESIIQQYEFLYNLRDLRKVFIPIEIIAKDPALYGYPQLDPIQSKARQKDFINDKSKIVAAIAANRSGKTESGAVKFLNICLNSKVSGRAWVLTESFDLQKTSTQLKILE